MRVFNRGSKDKKITTITTVVKQDRTCGVCRTVIPRDNWALFAIVKVGRRQVSKILIHDNDGCCLARLKVQEGLEKPSFKSSKIPTSW